MGRAVTAGRGWAAVRATGAIFLVLLLLVGLGNLLPGPSPQVAAVPNAGHPALMERSVSLSPKVPRSTLNGIDVSSYQGSINWGSVHAAGISFAFAKASQGNYYIDPTFASNEQNGKAAGVYMAAYDFADPVNVGAATEANYFDSVAGPYFRSGYMYPALDLEQGCGTLSRSALSSWVVTWMTTVENYIASTDGFNIVPIVYMNSNYANNCVDSSVTAYHLWIAEYCGGCTPNIGIFAYWNYYQWNDAGSYPGISGGVDQDIFGGDLPALQSGFVFGPPPLSASYAVADKTTGKALYCGGSFQAGDTIQFTGSASGGSSPYSYAWAFGDGATGSGNPATHVYTAIGTVNPLLTVTDASGAQAKSGAGCTFQVTGVPVTFYSSPASAGTFTLGSSTFTNGQSTTLPIGPTFPLSVTAPSGYVFSGWSWTGGVSISAPNSPTTSLTTTSGQAATVTASFVVRSAITFLSSPANAASVEIGGSVYNSGQNVTASVGTPYPLLALPNPGFVFVQWQVTGSGISVQAASQAYTNLTVLSTAPSVLTEVVLWNVPRAPAGLTVTDTSSSSISLTWAPPPGALVSYSLGLAAGASSPAGAGGFQLSSFGAGGNTYLLQGLAPGTQYWMALAGVNSTGRGQWSSWVTGTTLSLPDPPLYLTVDSTGDTYAFLSWETPTTGSSLTSYKINCSTSTPSAEARLISGISPTSTVYNVTRLTPGSQYSCSMLSVAGAYQSGPSNSVSFHLGGSAPSSTGGSGQGGPWSGLEGDLRTSARFPYVFLWVVAGALIVGTVALMQARRRRGKEGSDDGSSELNLPTEAGHATTPDPATPPTLAPPISSAELAPPLEEVTSAGSP